MSQLKHTLNSVYILFDLMISATPVRIFHLVYPMFVGAVYTIFNALYFINDGVGPDGKPYAYYVMDWRNPIESAVTCSLGFILTTVMQVLLYGLYRLRLVLYGYLLKNQERPPEASDVGADQSSEKLDPEVQGILTPAHHGTPQHASYNTLEQVEMVETKLKDSVDSRDVPWFMCVYVDNAVTWNKDIHQNRRNKPLTIV